MRFISKSGNLHIILKPGLPAQPLSGFSGSPTVSVRFQNGIADISDEELIQKMLKHPGFNLDFISSEDSNGADPYAYLRKDNEPQHITTEIKFGAPVSRKAPQVKRQLPDDIKRMIQEQATEIAKQMLPSMVKETLEVLAKSSANKSVQKTSGALKKSPGRPKKVEQVDETPATDGAVLEGEPQGVEA